ncbi:hypothetical protein ACIBP6_38405 [Nonomuraea terrae]|uniref:hypothetical protein n=1 Tax=Nonomuraea terrae TaxID=2530383 RepID=UPI0037B62ABE
MRRKAGRRAGDGSDAANGFLRPSGAFDIRDQSERTIRASLLPCQWEQDWTADVTLIPSGIELEERISEAGVRSASPPA